LPWSNQGFCCFESKGLVAWVHIDTDRGGIAGTICVECLKRITDRSECVMELAFRRKEKKRATLGNPLPLPKGSESLLQGGKIVIIELRLCGSVLRTLVSLQSVHHSPHIV
jgi:hypothetical protein